MKKPAIRFAEILYLLCFLLFLFASDLAHNEHGSELSLWLMTFAVILTLAAAVFPWLGIRWLKIEPAGSRTGHWLTVMFQFASWGAFAVAMAQRWGRSLNPFHWWITLTGLLWAVWILIFIYTRYAFSTGDRPKREDMNHPIPE